MLASAPVSLVLAVFAAAPETVRQAHPPDCPATPQHLELKAEPAGAVHPVCISPELVTTLIFDTPLPPGSVTLQPVEGGGVQVAQAGKFVTLMPSEKLAPGERRELEVSFGDGAAPTHATFVLVVHPARAERQVKVFRHARTVASYQHEVRVQQEELRQCQAENAQLRAVQGQPEGLTGLISAGLLREGGISVRRSTPDITTRPGSALKAILSWSYRSASRVAVKVELELPPGTQPWVAEGAALTGAGGRGLRGVRVWHSAPITPGTVQTVVVEAEALPEEAQGPFTLKLWEAGGKRTVALDGVVFPPLPGAIAP